jgi:hypothetical protein
VIAFKILLSTRNSLNVIVFLSDHLLASGECSSGNAGVNPGTTGVHRTDIWTHQVPLYTLSQWGTQIFIHIRLNVRSFCLDGQSQFFLYSAQKKIILIDAGLLGSWPILEGNDFFGKRTDNRLITNPFIENLLLISSVGIDSRR